jgi:hyperosmotically inducible periplasmic protein
MTMKQTALLFSLALLVLGGYASAAHSLEMAQAPAAQTAPDNTGRNVRDRSGATLTPGDQSETETDRTLTQRIRQAVVADETLSTTAKNIKIITTHGVVTLRGPVKTPQEKVVIEAKARQIAGAERVDSQLEIIAQ